MINYKKFFRYLVVWSERAPGYLFPFFLLTVEVILRDAFQLNTSEFIGPTLAAAGAGMVIYLVSYHDCNILPSDIPEEVKTYLSQNDKYRLETNLSILFRNFCLIVTLILTLLWIWAIILSTQSPDLMWWFFPVHYYPGMASYILGAILSEVKEVV